MVLIRVDLPQPFGPSTATHSFTWTRRLKSSRTIFPPRDTSPRITRTFFKSSNGAESFTLARDSTVQYRKDSPPHRIHRTFTKLQYLSNLPRLASFQLPF